MKLQLIFLLLILFQEAFSFGLYLRNLLRLVVLLKSFLMILMMVQLIQLDLLLCAYLKGVKESACWEATQFVFPSVFSGVDDCYYCSNIIVSLLFKLYAKFSI